MKVRLVLASFVALLLVGIIALGPVAHAFLPHTHSTNEAVTNLLHSAFRHEDKMLADMVPGAPAVLLVIAFLALPALSRAFALRGFDSRALSLALLRRGILLYRRFG